MSTIEERLLELIGEQDSVTHYNINGGSLMLRHHQDRRDAIHASIAADWNEMVEALEQINRLIHTTRNSYQAEQKAREITDAILARVKGEGS